MQDKKVIILSTRPLPASLVEKAATRNINLESDAFIDTIPVIDQQQETEITKLAAQSIVAVFTSMNAATAVSSSLKEIEPAWKIFALGTTTKSIVGQQFKRSIISGGAHNAGELAATIINEGDINSVVFFCGDQRREELPQMLKQQGIQVKEMVVYKTISKAHQLQKKFDGILFFSPSAVASFFENNQLDGEVVLFAIGATTATTIEHYSTNKVITSDRPGKEDLVEKVIIYFNTINENQ